MKLSYLQRGEEAEVLFVQAPKEINDRLQALNIYAGARIKILKISRKRGNFLVQAGGLVAMDKKVAEWVSVKRI